MVRSFRATFSMLEPLNGITLRPLKLLKLLKLDPVRPEQGLGQLAGFTI